MRGDERESLSQTRRRFIQTLGAVGTTAIGPLSAAVTDARTARTAEETEGTVGALSFYSPASQVAPDLNPLADDEVALVRAEPTAFNFETTEDGPEWAPVVYGEGDPAIPLVSKDTEDPVVGVGTIDFVADGTGGFGNDNEMFLLNLFDDLMGPDSLVAFDESHQFFQSLDDYEAFAAYADDQGYDIRATGEDLLDSGQLEFPSTASQIDQTGEDPLVNPEHIVVWAEETAENVDEEGDGAYIYDENPIPLVSRDGSVFGFGTPELVDDEFGIPENNGQFLLNVLGETVGDSGTLVWDDAHDTFWDSSKFGEFADAIEAEGYDFVSSGDDMLASDSELEFFSTSSLLRVEGEDDDDDGETRLPLTDTDRVAVWAEETATNLNVPEPLVVDTDDTGAATTHAWLFESVAFDGEIDTITVDYPETASFDGLDETDITVLVTRELADGLDMEEIPVNSGGDTEIGGSTATFDLSGIFATSVAGPVAVRIDGVDNPDETEYEATITFEGDDEETLTAGPARDEEGNLVGSTGTVPYPEPFDIPLVGVDDPGDGTVVGVGSDFASDESDQENREMLVDAWTDRIGETGTVRYDETHGQNSLLDEDFSQLVDEAESRGFTVDAITEEFEDALDEADAVMVASDDDDLDPFAESELNALEGFVADGRALLLHDTAYFEGDSTGVLNEVLSAVGADIRFNADQVRDEANSGFAPFVPRTSNFNEADYPGFFESLDEGGTIEAADAVAIPSPSDAYTDAELDALSTHAEEGGGVFLFDQSEFENEETANLNEIAEALDLPFAFNPDQVQDPENNAGVDFVPTTLKFNEAFDLFGGLESVGLQDADGVIITTPDLEFFDSELDALADFVDAGGAVFLFDQSDFGGQDEDEEGFDETENLNEIAETLDLDFRFNADQVNDEDNNNGPEFDPLTANYDVDPDDPGVFAEREAGIGIEFERDEAYFGRVVRVFDGDTFEVEFDEQHDPFGFRDVVRHLGMDTAETGDAENEPEEWFGVPDDELDHLDNWGSNATEFALDVMTPDGTESGDIIEDGRRVKMTFGEREPLLDNFGRLLAFMEYDPDEFEPDPPEDGNYEVDYNRETVEEGYARVYSSGFARHDDYAEAEETALAEGTGVWSASDFDAMTPFRTGFVDEVFVPRPSSVTTTAGPLGEVGTNAEPILQAGDTAEQDPLDDEFDEYDDAPPLAAVDTDNRVAVFGGVLLHEIYEGGDEPGDGDDITDEYDLDEAGNFPLFTNTVELLTDNDGPFIIEGGHGQFNVEGSVSLERVQFYLRHVEGLSNQVENDIRLRQINDLVETLLAEEPDPRVVFLTAPERDYTEAELDALAEFRDAGGAVVLLGSAAPEPDERARLNDIAAALGTDLRLNDDRVVDESGPIDAEDLLVTDNVDEADGLRLPVDLDRSFDDTGVMAALNNVGAEAWTLDAASAGVGPLDEENPTLTLPEGRRIHIENRGAGPHPLAVRDADGNPLLTQDGEGTFEDDPAVEWVDTGDIVEFTLTADLAEEVATYGCEVHGAMEGDIEVGATQPPALPGGEGPPQDLDGDGLFEDIRGSGKFRIFDVQMLFDNLDTPEVQQHAKFFKFSDPEAESPDSVDITDVQALFNRLVEHEK